MMMMMLEMTRMWSFFVFCLAIFVVVEARPPVKQDPKTPEVAHNNSEWDLGIEYNRYLQEIVQVLESDPEFRKKLESADVDKIRDGSIAHELEFVGHHVRNKLDDIKRRELDRLRRLAVKQHEIKSGFDRKRIMFDHIDMSNAQFEIEDLKKLIQSTTKELEEADRRRKKDFKAYEMEKKFEREERLKAVKDEEERKKVEEQIHQAEKRHKEHEKLNHPMTKDQLEEVWEKEDHMRPEDWDPKTFFAMHDLNGDGVWDENEMKMLFKKELDKAYDPNNKDDDMKEREEEMELMREHVFKESDKDGDRLISFEEFLDETKRDEFNKDPGWDTLDDHDENDLYSEEEFRAFEVQRQREIQEMLDRGIVPPGYPYYGDLPPGAIPYSPGMPPQGVPRSIPGQPAYNPQQQPFGQAPPHPGQFGQQPPPHPGQFGQQQPPHPGQFGQQQPPHPGQLGQQQPPHPGQFGQQQPSHPGQLGQQLPPHPGQQPPPHPGQQPPPHPGQQPFGSPQQPDQQFGQPRQGQQPQQLGQQHPQQGQPQQFVQHPPPAPGQGPNQPNAPAGGQPQQQGQQPEPAQPQPRGQPPIRSQEPSGSRNFQQSPDQPQQQQQEQKLQEPKP